MGVRNIFISSVFVILLGLLLAHFKILDFLGFGKRDVELAICILSARDNFNHRSAIRRSWMTDISAEHNRSVVAKFVVGKSSCPIPPKDRLDPYGCERWEPTLPEEESDLPVFMMTEDKHHRRGQLVQSLYVKVMHDVILKRLGLTELLHLDKLVVNQSVDVVLYDAVTDEEITSVTFTHTQKGVNSNGYFYRPVQELLLPKGYELNLEVKLPEVVPWPPWTVGDSTRRQLLSQGQGHWLVHEGHHGIVLVKFLESDGTASHSENSWTLLPVASFMFSIQDVQALKRHLALVPERNLTWQGEITAVTAQLQEEEVRHKDLLLVDVVDVYRNLPDKLLLCHEWLHDHYTANYVMKTDDDCFINLPQIMTLLPEVMTSLPYAKGKSMNWWGSFRAGWSVERFGKWREEKFSSSVYPKFGCGSGNILSYSLHTWLVDNRHLLRRFQGEDVSVGIWLSGLDVSFLQDDRWRCDMTCQNDMLSLPELTEDMIWWHWNNSKHCSSPCSPC